MRTEHDRTTCAACQTESWTDDRHDPLGNSLGNSHEDLAALEDGSPLSSERRAELEKVAADNPPVIRRWLDDLEPHLPPSLRESAEWRSLVRRARALPKGSHHQEAARERLLKRWMFDGLTVLEKHSPSAVKEPLKAFLDKPDLPSREIFLDALLDHATTLGPANARVIVRSLRTIFSHTHSPQADGYATVLAEGLNILDLSPRDRESFWQEMDPIGTLRRLIDAKHGDYSTEFESLGRSHPGVVKRWLDSIEPHLPTSVSAATEWRQAATTARTTARGSWLAELRRSAVFERWMWQSLALLSGYMPEDVQKAWRDLLQYRNNRAIDVAFGAVEKHAKERLLRGDMEAARTIRAHAQFVRDSAHLPSESEYAGAVVHALAIASERMTGWQIEEFWRKADPAKALRDALEVRE